MNSMQSSMASFLWESTGVTNGFDLPDEEIFGDFLFFIAIKRIPFATLDLRCLKNGRGESSDRLGSLNPQLPVIPLFRSIEFFFRESGSFPLAGLRVTWVLSVVEVAAIDGVGLDRGEAECYRWCQRKKLKAERIE